MKRTWHSVLGDAWWQRAWNLNFELALPGTAPGHPDLTFAAFSETSPDDCKVLILGQDPYPAPGKARGVAFGFHPEYSAPIDSSMRSILEELKAEEIVEFDMHEKERREWLSLRHWTEQGVLLLNTRLTVEHLRPMSHAGKGWEPLMKEALGKIAAEINPVVMAWGREARLAAEEHPFTDIVSCSHPSRYSARATDNPFIGSRCFWTVNAKLNVRGRRPIAWI